MFPLALSAVPWKLVGAATVVICISLMGWRVSAWHAAYEALPGVQDALRREEGCEDGSRCAERVAALRASQAKVEANILAGYENELAALRNRPIERRVIRLCKPTDPGNVRLPADPGDPAAPAGSGVVLAADEFDTGPLRDLALKADEVSAAYRALRDRDTALATP